MASEVSICNLALVRLGASTIASLTENTKEGRRCNALYEINRDIVLRAHPWNFAITRAVLAEDTTTPVYEFDHRYSLPVGCLRVLRLGENHEDLNYKVEGRYVVTDENSASILYVARVTDPNQFDTLFIEALAAKLAAELAFDITATGATGQQLLRREYTDKLAEARGTDAREGFPDAVSNGSWLDSRV